MKRLRIKVDKPNTPAELYLNHIATSYRISKHPNVHESKNVVFESLEDSINLYELIIDLDLKESDTVYYTTQYHYQDATGTMFTSDWSLPTLVRPERNGLTLPNTIIKTPKVTHDYTEEEVLSIGSNSMSLFTGIGRHNKTTWVVKDSDGVIVYQRSDDRDNLTELLPEWKPEPGKAYMIEAIHSTDTNSESNQGRSIFLNYTKAVDLYDFELITTFYVGTNVWHRVKIYVPNFKNYDVEIRTATGQVVAKLEKCDTLVYYINTSGFEYNAPYQWYVRVRFSDDSVTDWALAHEGIAYNKDEDADLDGEEDRTYLKKITDGPLWYISSTSNQLSNINTFEITNKEFFWIEDNKIVLYKLDSNRITKVKDLFTLSAQNTFDSKDNVENTVLPYASFIKVDEFDFICMYKVLNNNDHYGATRFLRFIYNPVLKSVTLQNSLEIKDEDTGFGVSNGYARLSSVTTPIYWFVYEQDPSIKPMKAGIILLKLEVSEKDMTYTTFLAKKTGIYHSARLFVNKSKKLCLIAGTSKYTTNIFTSEQVYKRDSNVILQIDTSKLRTLKAGTYNTIAEAFDVTRTIANLPTDKSPYTIFNFHPIKLKSGDVLLFNNSEKGEELGNQDLLVYASESNGFILEEYNKGLAVPFRNTIEMKNWDIIRVSSNVEGEQICYTYLSTNNESDEHTDSTATISYPTTLSFKHDQTVIEHPYQFEDTNTGLETPKGKKLVWVDKTQHRTFTNYHPIYTRSHTEPTSEEGLPIEYCRSLDMLNNVTVNVEMGQIVGENSYDSGEDENPTPYTPSLIVSTNAVTLATDGSATVGVEHNQKYFDVSIDTVGRNLVTIEELSEGNFGKNASFVVKSKGQVGNFTLTVNLYNTNEDVIRTSTITGVIK